MGLEDESDGADEEGAERGCEEDRQVDGHCFRAGTFCEAVEVSFTCGLAGCLGGRASVTRETRKREREAYVDTREVLRREHVGRIRHEPHRRHLGPVKPIQLHLIIPPRRIHSDSPIGIKRDLVVFRDQVGDRCAWVLDLDPPVRGERVERHGAVVV